MASKACYRSGTAALLMMAALIVHIADAPAAGTARDISGVWWIKDYEAMLTPLDGTSVPFTAKGLADYRQTMALQDQGQLLDKAISRCLPAGLPRAMLSGYPLKIVQHGKSLTFIHEQNHAFWHAVFDVDHTWTDNDESAFMGADSVARWEGDTLVIDTIGFKPNSFLDDRGMPHTDQLHLVQRFRITHQGKVLEDLITVDDPVVFTRPWQARRTYELRRDIKLMEYVCGDPQRALTGERAKALHWSGKF